MMPNPQTPISVSTATDVRLQHSPTLLPPAHALLPSASAPPAIPSKTIPLR